MDLIAASNQLCALVYAVLAALLVVHSGKRAPVVLLVAACATTGLWALAVSLDVGQRLGVGVAVGFLDVLKSIAWVGFLAGAYQAGLPAGMRTRGLRVLLLGGAALGLALLIRELIPTSRLFPAAERALFVSSLYGRLAIAIAGLVLTEALLQQARERGHWRVRYLCLGVGGLLVYELFFFSEALLFRRLDPGLGAARGAVSLVIAPLIAVAAARNPVWATELNVARRAAMHTATLFVVALYLLAVALLGAGLRAVHGDWGRVMQATLLFGAIILLVVVWISPTARALWREQLVRYFFTHRHDYREQWQRFAEDLAAETPGRSLQERALRAVAGIVDSPGGGLWLREGEAFARAAAIGLPSDADNTTAEDPLQEGLDGLGDEILELAPVDGTAPRPEWLPEWLDRWSAAWVLVPLTHREERVGFIVLARPPGRRGLDLEDADLLQIVGRQTAGYLAEERNTRALAEARRFDEISRRMAFIAHDLRKLANELSLMLANSRTHIRNPEFQQDLLQGMEETVAGMQRLLDRLHGDAEETRAPSPVDFAELLDGAWRGPSSEPTYVELEIERGSPLWILADADRLNAISGHLIRNAIEAAGADGHVCVRLRREGDQALLEIKDDGGGMTPEFVQERLSHPFESSKRGGLGLGLYQCRQLARELGGELEIDSELGRGTVARVRLPLAPDAAARG